MVFASLGTNRVLTPITILSTLLCGETGIRTLGTLLGYAYLANKSFRPLRHLSNLFYTCKEKIGKIYQAKRYVAHFDNSSINNRIHNMSKDLNPGFSIMEKERKEQPINIATSKALKKPQPSRIIPIPVKRDGNCFFCLKSVINPHNNKDITNNR